MLDQYCDVPLPLKPDESDCNLLFIMLNPFLDWRKMLGKKLD